MHAKFDHFSFSRSGDIGDHWNLNGSRDIYHGPCDQGQFAIHGLALATINLSSKFEVSISSHYEDMNGDTKCRQWGGLG